MGMKETVENLMRPIIAPYTTPRGAAAGILGLINPAAGALVRYGPDILSAMSAMGSASSGQGAEQSGSRSRSRGMSGMMPLSGGSGRGYGVGGSGGLPLSDLSQYFQRGRALDDSDMRGSIPTMNQGGLVQQVIADRQRVLDSFTPNPYDQYQYLMENPATRQAPTDDEVVPADPTPATPADTFTNLLGTLGNIGVQSATGGSDPAPMSPLEARIAELMENRGMTQQEAAANQAFAAQQGADLNNDGAITNAEYALFMRSQEPTVSTMPVGDPVPLTPNPMGGGFLSSVFNSEGIQQAIDDAIASMGDRSGGVDAPATAPATPTIPENLQERIAALTGGAGGFGGMIPNIDVDRLRELMAELYGGQTPPVRGPEFRPPPPRRIVVDRRMGEGMR